MLELLVNLNFPAQGLLHLGGLDHAFVQFFYCHFYP